MVLISEYGNYFLFYKSSFTVVIFDYFLKLHDNAPINTLHLPVLLQDYNLRVNSKF